MEESSVSLYSSGGGEWWKQELDLSQFILETDIRKRSCPTEYRTVSVSLVSVV